MRVHAISIAIAAALLSNTVILLYYRAQLARAHTAIAIEREQHAIHLKSLSETAIAAQQKTYADYQAAVIKIENLDTQLTKEYLAHETDNLNYRIALTNGTERLRVALANRSTHHNRLRNMPQTIPATSMGDGSPTYADIDPPTAESIFRVAADADHEISKLRALQGYVCAVRPEMVGCLKSTNVLKQ